jgi:hypothetical protein
VAYRAIAHHLAIQKSGAEYCCILLHIGSHGLVIETDNFQWGGKMIRHTVVFNLKHAAGSKQEASFMKAALRLGTIPGVDRFEQLRQISQKNNFSFGFSMEFGNQAAYDGYNQHPDHVAFVQDRWVPEVSEFMEIDYVPLT